MGTFNDTWNSIRGKVTTTSTFFSRSMTKSLWGSEVTIDYTRNDYDLYRSIYFGAVLNGKGKEYQIGAMFAKPIVNSSAGFTIGDGFTIGLDKQYAKAEAKINDWLKDNHANILDAVRHQLRDGDSYLYIDEFGFMDEFDAKDVAIMLDPMTGEIIGYDVNEVYEEVDPQNGQKQKWNLLRMYRTDSVKYIKYKDNQRDKATTIYSRVFTIDGAVEPNENQQYFVDDIVPRALPVVHFANDPEPRAVYGNSELLNCLVGIQNYTAVAANATKGVIYNSSPVPYITGVSNEEKVAKASNTGAVNHDDDSKTNWGPDTVLYFADKDAKAGFLQANGFMADVGKLLEYYFYLIVQASETPEFIFGTAVSSSQASVKEQMPIVTQKAERKRAQLYDPIKQLVEAYVDRKVRLSDPDFLPLKGKDFDMDIEFPELVDEDKALTLEIVKEMLTQGVLSEETALTLLLGDKIPDITKELATAHSEAETKIAQDNAVQFEANRMQMELANSLQQPTETKVTKEMAEQVVSEVWHPYGNPYAKGQRGGSGGGGGGSLEGEAKHIGDQPLITNFPKKKGESESAYASRYVKERYNEMEKRYQAHTRAEFGVKKANIAASDEAKFCIPGYLTRDAKGKNVWNDHLSTAYHAASKDFEKKYFTNLLARKDTAGREVMFTAGGSGSGKTSGIQKISRPWENYAAVLDSNMSIRTQALGYIKQANDSGRKASVMYVERGPLDSFKGVVSRIAIKNRIVNIDSVVDTHVGSRENAVYFATKFKNNPNVNVHVIDNTGGFGEQKFATTAIIPRLDASTLRPQMVSIADQSLKAGEINQVQYSALVAGGNSSG